MSAFRKHWRVVLGGLATAYGIVRAILDAIGTVDTVLAHVPGQDQSWLSRVMEFLLHPRLGRYSL